MKTIQINLYQYSELNDKAKEKARKWWLECFDFNFEWDCIADDAKTVGIKLDEWDYGRTCKGELTLDFTQVMSNIIAEHGETCETYKTAKQYQAEYMKLSDEQETEKETLEEDFIKSILEDYRIMADKQYEYCQSDEAISEIMESNEYTFTIDGKRF